MSQIGNDWYNSELTRMRICDYIDVYWGGVLSHSDLGFESSASAPPPSNHGGPKRGG